MQNIPAKPNNFSSESPLLPEYHPVWGTCPDSDINFDFSTGISVSDASDNTAELTFGTSAEATTGFDPLLDEFAPPPGPAGTFDARINYEEESYFTFFQPTTVEQTQWPMQVRPSSGNAPVTLSWDPASLAEEGLFVLSGSGIHVNMREHDTLEIPGSGPHALTITHSLTAEANVEYAAGWNLVGLAYDMPHEDYQEIFTGSLENTLFSFDGSYTQQQALEMGQGYWLRFGSESTVVFSGSPEPIVTADLDADWNLISGHAGCDGPCGIEDPDEIIITGTLYGFDGSYFQADGLEGGHGYWVRTDVAGSIEIGGETTNTAPVTTTEQGLQEYAVLSLGPAEARKRDLLFGADTAEPVHPQQYSLPPLPPPGAFDARFSGDVWLIDEMVAEVALQSGGQPVELGFTQGENSAGMAAELVLMRDDQPVGTHWLESGESIELASDITKVQVTLTTSTSIPNEMPARFALSQNYPNPFNPTTNITYALPEAANVRLEVFNIMGQRVATLVNNQQNAGYHTVTFDASRLSSGMYIYRLSADGFVESRTMMLVK